MVEIKAHPHKIQCDMCVSRDTFTISKKGTSALQQPALCRSCLKDIVIAGMELFKDEIPVRESVPEDYEGLKLENGNLKAELERSRAKINERKEPKGRAVHTARSMKGKGKK